MTRHRAAYTVDEAAELVGLPRTAIYDAIRRGDLTAAPFGRRLVILAQSLESRLGIDLDGDAESDGVNRVEITGRLLEAPQSRVSRRGLPYCTLRILVGLPGDSDAVEVELTAYGRRAETAAAAAVGQILRIGAHLARREWQTPEGTRRVSHRIVVDRVRLLHMEASESVSS